MKFRPFSISKIGNISPREFRLTDNAPLVSIVPGRPTETITKRRVETMARGGKWKASTELRRWRSLIGCYLTRPEERESSWLKRLGWKTVSTFMNINDIVLTLSSVISRPECASSEIFYFIAGTKSKFAIKIISYAFSCTV